MLIARMIEANTIVMGTLLRRPPEVVPTAATDGVPTTAAEPAPEDAALATRPTAGMPGELDQPATKRPTHNDSVVNTPNWTTLLRLIASNTRVLGSRLRTARL